MKTTALSKTLRIKKALEDVSWMNNSRTFIQGVRSVSDEIQTPPVFPHHFGIKCEFPWHRSPNSNSQYPILDVEDQTLIFAFQCCTTIALPASIFTVCFCLSWEKSRKLYIKTVHFMRKDNLIRNHKTVCISICSPFSETQKFVLKIYQAMQHLRRQDQH